MSDFKSDQYGPCTLTVKHACPIELTMHIMGGKWKGIILSLLSKSPMYYNAMRREIPGVTQRILTLQLRDMEKNGLIEREETNDVFLSSKYESLQKLPNNAIIGSASLRRQAQLLHMNPIWKVINFRGNVQSRISKMQLGILYYYTTTNHILYIT